MEKFVHLTSKLANSSCVNTLVWLWYISQALCAGNPDQFTNIKVRVVEVFASSKRFDNIRGETCDVVFCCYGNQTVNNSEVQLHASGTLPQASI